MIFSEELNWDSHVDSIAKSASRRVHVLRQLKKLPSITKKDLLLVYESYILSTIEYNAPLFTRMSRKNNERLERIRKGCHNIICGFHCDCYDFATLSTRRLTVSDSSNESFLPHAKPTTPHSFTHSSCYVLFKTFLP